MHRVTASDLPHSWRPGCPVPPSQLRLLRLQYRDWAGARRTGEIVVNARVDVFIREWGDPADRLAEAVRRGRLYLEAGAECVYPIWVVDEETIARLVDELAAPVNVLYRPGAPSLRRLAELGVARISLGPGLHRAAEAATRAILEQMAAGGDPY